MERIKQYKSFAAAAVIFSAVLFLFFYFLPMTLDDWAWGSETGALRLRTFFDGYNGRYLGNLLTVALTRFALLRAAVMTAVTVLLLVQITKYVTKTASVWGFLAATVLLFSTVLPGFLDARLNLFDQTIGWTSGFTNYVVPSVLLMAYLLTADRDFREPQATHRRAAPLWMLLLGTAGALFVEHITLFAVMLAGAVNFYFIFLQKRKPSPVHLGYLAGTVLGAALMFSNSSYRMMVTGEGRENAAYGYRALGLPSADGIRRVAEKLSVSVWLLAAAAVVAAVLLCALVFLAVRTGKTKNERLRLLAPLVLAVLMTLPLLFANGGEHSSLYIMRVYFTQYIMLMLFLLSLAKMLTAGKAKKALRACACVLAAALTVFFAVTYAGIDRVDGARERYIASQLREDKPVINIIDYPAGYERFVYMSDSFKENDWTEQFMAYHRIPKTKKLHLITYEEYQKQ